MTSRPVRLLFLPAALTAAVAAPAAADEIVVPNNAPTTAGPGGYTTLLHAQARSYQLVVGPEELGGMPAGSSITAITWRLPTWIAYPDWPGVGTTCSFGNYDISLSSSNFPPGSLSTTYTPTTSVATSPSSVRGPSISRAFTFPAVGFRRR